MSWTRDKKFFVHSGLLGGKFGFDLNVNLQVQSYAVLPNKK
jgi:hypothetical protein